MRNSVAFGTAAVTTASTKAIESTEPVFWSTIRAPAATPRRCGGTAPIIAAVLGLRNMPDPTPTIARVVALSANELFTPSAVISARPTAVTSMPAAASPREPCLSA